MSSAPPRPPSQVPAASSNGSPGRYPGVIQPPDTMNPGVAKSSPPLPPKAAADSGIRAVPCPAIQ